MCSLLKTIDVTIAMGVRKIKYKKKSHPMYEQNKCNEFLNHVTPTSALEICAAGARGRKKVVKVVRGAPECSKLAASQNRDFEVTLFLLRNYH